MAAPYMAPNEVRHRLLPSNSGGPSPSSYGGGGGGGATSGREKKTEFARMAAVVGREINGTAAKLEKLAKCKLNYELEWNGSSVSVLPHNPVHSGQEEVSL